LLRKKPNAVFTKDKEVAIFGAHATIAFGKRPEIHITIWVIARLVNKRNASLSLVRAYQHNQIKEHAVCVIRKNQRC
jgi:hypothetical protein